MRFSKRPCFIRRLTNFRSRGNSSTWHSTTMRNSMQYYKKSRSCPSTNPSGWKESSSLRIWCADTVNEENRLFPIARRELEDCRAEELGRQIEEIKGKESAPDEFVGSRQQTLHLNEYPLQN